MHDLEQAVTLASFPQCFVELDDLGKYRIAPILTYIELEDSPRQPTSIMSMFMNMTKPKAIQPKAFIVLPVVEFNGIVRQRPEDFFGHKLWTTLLFLVDEGGVRNKVVGVQALDDAGKQVCKYQAIEVQMKIIDRGKAALAKAQELGLLAEMDEIWKQMALPIAGV